MSTSSAAPRASRVRYLVLLMLCLLAMITYMDRAMLGNAKGDIMGSIGKSEQDFFLILVAFQLAYALFEIPTGWMGDTYGPRKTLIRIVLWWSFFVALTAFTGWKFSYETWFYLLIGIQFLFGMGEAGAFPNMSRALYNWFPAKERGFAQGAMWLSARFMGGLTPLVWLVFTKYLGLDWRETLWSFAAVAVMWCIIFYLFFTNTPKEHPKVNEEEAKIIDENRQPPSGHAGVPWKAIFGNKNVIFLCLMYMVTNFNWYFLMYFVPRTLKTEFASFGAKKGGDLLLAVFGGAPLLVGMFGCLLGGYLTDLYFRRTNNRKMARRVIGMAGYGLAGCCYILAALSVGNLYAFAISLMFVGFFNDLILSPAWATAQDIGQRYSAIVSGAMNMIGNLGATLGIFISGRILKAHTVTNDAGNDEVGSQAYIILFTIYAIIYGLGVFLWTQIDASKPITVPEKPHDHETATS